MILGIIIVDFRQVIQQMFGKDIELRGCGMFDLRQFLPAFLLLATISIMMGCSTEAPSSRELYGAFLKDEKLGDIQKAKADLSGILKVHPADPVAWNDLAYLDFLSHHYKKAQWALSQGLALNPSDHFLLLNKARLFLAEGENQKARMILLPMISSHPWPKGFRMILAIADSRTGHPDSARVLFSEILSERPSDSLASIYLFRLSGNGRTIKGSRNG